MVREGDFVAIFHSIHRVMQAEKLLKGAGASVLLIPVPRQLTSDCGLAIRFSPGEREKVEALLVEGGLPLQELHRRTTEGYFREV